MENFEYPLTFPEWKEIFRVSSKFERDTALEEDIKELERQFEEQKKLKIVESALKYNRITQNLTRL